MNNRMKRRVAAIDESVALKSLHTIEELGKEYKLVVVPKTVVDKINNTNKQLRSQFFRIFLMNSNVIIRDYIDDNRMFDFAMDASKEFKCPVDIISYDDYDGFCYRYISNIKVHVGTQIRYTEQFSKRRRTNGRYIKNNCCY